MRQPVNELKNLLSAEGLRLYICLSQASLDEGLLLQQALHEVFSEGEFLLNCLGTKFTKTQEKNVSDALSESTRALESLSKSLVSCSSVTKLYATM